MSESVAVSSGNQTENSEKSQKLTHWRWLLAAYLVAIVSQFPLYGIYLKNLYGKEHYQFFPFVFVAMGVLIYSRWPRNEGPFIKSWTSCILFLIGLGLGFAATLFVDPQIAAWSVSILSASFLARVYSEFNGKSLIAISILLFVILKPPIIGDQYAINRLQTVSSNVTSMMLDLMDYKHHLAGNQIDLPNGGLYGVEEGCSGIQSFYTLLFCTSVFILLMRRPFVRAVALLISAGLWAILLNTVRIIVIATTGEMFGVNSGVNLAEGWQHDVLGYTTLTLAVLCVVSTDQLLFFLFGPIDMAFVDTGNRTKKMFASIWNRVMAGGESDRNDRKGTIKSPLRIERIIAMSGAVLIGLLFFVQVSDVSRLLTQKKRVSFFANDVVYPLNQSSMPQNLATWTAKEYQIEERSSTSDLGLRSDLWIYNSDSGQALVALDQPFPGWHELTTCYKGQGWKMVYRKKKSAKILNSETEWPYIEAMFSKSSGEYGYLLFSHFDVQGVPFEAPVGSFSAFMTRVKNRMSHRVRARLFRGEAYQTQVFVRYGAEPTEEIKADVLDNYLIARELMRQQFESGNVQQMRDQANSNTVAAAN